MRVYEFDSFRLDLFERLLLLRGKPVPLASKVFDLLSLLVRNSGHLVEKSEIMKTVWSDSAVEDNNLTVSISALRKALSDSQDEHQYIETVPKRGYRFVADIKILTREDDAKNYSLEARESIRGKSMAVLPFNILGEELDQGYLALGMADALTTILSHVSQIIVLSTRTVMKYARPGLDPISVGRKLGADCVLDGQIQKIGEQIRVTVQLIDTRNGQVIWAEKYDERLVNIFSAQDSISEQVVRKLLPQLSCDEFSSLTKRSTENPDAFRLYSKGRYFWNKRNAEGLERAVEYFKRAVELDSNYALAYAGLADAYTLLSDYNWRKPRQVMPKAKAAAIRAIEIDSTLAEAHASLGFINSVYEWDWAGAEREFKKALELNPNYVTAHHWYATYLRCMGRFDEAIKELRHAQMLDPTALAINIAMGSCLYLARKYDQAIIQCRETLEFDPASVFVYSRLGAALTQKGMYQEAIAEHKKGLKLADHAQGWSLLGYTYAISGNREAARKILEDLTETFQRIYFDPAYLAVVCAGLGDNDQALAWLERAYENRSDSLMYLKVDPELDGLRSDPRFVNLLQRTNLESEIVRHTKVIDSLAVFPLANTSNDSNMEYLGTGIAVSIINSLSNLSSLKVMAPSTVSHYKGDIVDPIEIGNRLRVGAVLIGNLLQLNEKLIIKMELVNVADGSQIWGEEYNRPVSDLFSVQEEISYEVSEKLRLRLTNEEREQLSKRYTENIEAYHLYLKGRYFWGKYTVDEVKKSINYFQQAINVDPDYALAYAGLADSYQRLSNFVFSPKEAMPKAMAAAMRSVEIDDTVPEAYLALGLVKMYYHHDWEGAEKDLRKATYLAPRSPLTHQRYATFLMYMGRLDEAWREHKIAHDLDPLSLSINTYMGTNLFLLRRYDEAISQLQKTLELDSRYYQAQVTLGMAYTYKGDFSEAIAQLQQARLIDENPVLLGLLGYAYAMSESKVEAMKVLEQIKGRGKRTYLSPYSIALIYLGLGDKDKAFHWLEKTYEDENDWLLWLKVGPELDCLREEPRFIDLLRRIGFRF
ncbi:MAG: tetratricopeptide repeat protein [Pyrinomonadaceae bacterium]